MKEDSTNFWLSVLVFILAAGILHSWFSLGWLMAGIAAIIIAFLFKRWQDGPPPSPPMPAPIT